MTEEQLSRLRTWAASLAKDGTGEKEAAGRTIQVLADRVEQLRHGEYPYWDRIELSEAKRLARQLSSGEGPAARRSAARAIMLLLEEHDRLADAPRELLPAWPGRKVHANGNGHVNGNGNGSGNGNGNGALLAPRRMPLPEQRLPSKVPPRDPDDDEYGSSLDGMLPSGRAIRRALYWLIGAAIVAGTFFYAPKAAAPDIEVSGPTEDRIGMREADVLTFSVTSPEVANARWSVDGKTLEKGVRRRGMTSTMKAVALPEGAHEVVVKVPGPIPGATARHEWNFEIDLTPPSIELAANAGKANWGQPMTVGGTVSEEATIRVAGRDAPVENGTFSLGFDTPPRQASLVVTATDVAGNVAESRVPMNVIPREPSIPTRGVHVTFYTWKWPDLRAPILDLVDSGKVSVVELDLKDESGIVGFDADIPLGKKMGTVQDIYDLREAVQILHDKGVRVVGRLVAFRDPIHAAAAWDAGRKAEVVQTQSGEPYAGYGGFTNFANPAVRQYNIDIAKAAVAAGVDDILYDYVRRPDGPRASMRFPGLEGRPDKSIAAFLRETREQLPERVHIGASVFGVAASRPQDIAQNIPMMARELDYVAPMVYPSHWSADEYGVPNPNAQPYDIVVRSLEHFQRLVRGTGARLVPWLQDFSLGYTYGPNEVRAQIDAAKEVGVDEWILWNPRSKYTSDALESGN